MTLPPKTPLEIAWEQRNKLYTKARTLFDQARALLAVDEHSAYGSKCFGEAAILEHRGDITFYDAAIATYGPNAQVIWSKDGISSIEEMPYVGLPVARGEVA